MPNWCNNTISIEGPKDQITALWNRANEEGSGLLNAISPTPENMFHGNLGEKERKECEAKGIPNWYDWCVSNWGTKWDVDIDGLELSEDGTCISGWFDSAWAPPIGAYSTFLAENPDCSLEAWYEEGGMDFAGHYDNGADDYLEDISNYARKVIRTGASGDPLFDELDAYFDITESRREWLEEDMETEDERVVREFIVEGKAQNMENA